MLAPLQFEQAELALLAVNDNPDAEQAEGGSHWSLLAYCAADNTFRHYTSLRGLNREAASRVFAAAARPGSTLVEQATPQQANGYDCGLYVLALAHTLCQRFSERRQGMTFEVAPGAITPERAAALRQEVLDLIRRKVRAAEAAGG